MNGGSEPQDFGLRPERARAHEKSRNYTTSRLPPSSGFSGETILVDADWTEGGTRSAHPLVIRVEPTVYDVFFEERGRDWIEFEQGTTTNSGTVDGEGGQHDYSLR